MIYKYLPSRYADAFIRKGEVLFRNLTSYRQIEDEARGDEIEGIHVDDPGGGVRIQNLTRGFTVVGDYRFLNSVNQNRVFVFCASTELRPSLFDEFACDACVAIHDEADFFRRCAAAAGRVTPIEKPGLIHHRIAYFQTGKPAPLDVKDPKKIPFMKHDVFAPQSEYRAVFAELGGFRLTQRVVTRAFEFRQEIANGIRMERLLRVGDLRGIAKVIMRASVVAQSA